jgi:hypothetical protein
MAVELVQQLLSVCHGCQTCAMAVELVPWLFSNFLESLILGNKLDPTKAKRTFYFSEGRQNTPSDLASTPQ